MQVKNEAKLSAVEKCIKDYAVANNGQTPSLMVIMKETGLPKATAYRQVMELQRRGIVHYNGKRTLSVDGERYAKSSFVRTPIVGYVVCGAPNEQEEHIEGYMAIPAEWSDGECFLLRAYGDSMIDVGVAEGDLVLVRKCEETHDGQIVVALTEDGNTLKRLRYENGRPVLYAENNNYTKKEKRIVPAELHIQGAALKVIKDLR